MAAPYIDIPLLSSIRFVEYDPTQAVQYQTRHFDDYLFKEQIQDFMFPAQYAQKRQQNDTDVIQFQSDYAPFQVQLVNCSNQVIKTVNIPVVATGLINPMANTYQENFTYDIVPPGRYWMLLRGGMGNDIEAISEPIDVDVTHPYTVLLEYSNSINKDTVYFGGGAIFKLRLDAQIMRMEPASKDTMYTNQTQNETLLRSYAYRIFNFVVSAYEGVPDWMIDKLNRIFGCDKVLIDGKQFTKDEGAKWENTDVEMYPMSGWKIKLREAKNRTAIRMSTDPNPQENIIVSHDIETDGFGNVSQIVRLTNIE